MGVINIPLRTNCVFIYTPTTRDIRLFWRTCVSRTKTPNPCSPPTTFARRKSSINIFSVQRFYLQAEKPIGLFLYPDRSWHVILLTCFRELAIQIHNSSGGTLRHTACHRRSMAKLIFLRSTDACENNLEEIFMGFLCFMSFTMVLVLEANLDF